MKKIAIFFLIIIAIVSTIFYIYFNYVASYNAIKKENAKFEKYIDVELTSTELATIINKIVDENEKNEIEKNEQGKYIDNSENSINADVKFIENAEKEQYSIYGLETIYNVGIENLLSLYSDTTFICNHVEYHKKTGKIKYMMFEELQK